MSQERSKAMCGQGSTSVGETLAHGQPQDTQSLQKQRVVSYKYSSSWYTADPLACVNATEKQQQGSLLLAEQMGMPAN